MANIDEYLQAIKTAIYGEQVRGAIHDSIEEINNVVETTDATIVGKTVGIIGDVFENSFEAVTGNKALSFKSGRYTTGDVTPTTGVEVSFSANTGTEFACAICPCSPGDIFIAHISGYSGNNRAFFFCNSEMHIVSGGAGKAYAATNYVLDGKITAPEGSAYVIFNNMLSRLSTGYFAIKGELFSQNIEEQLDAAVQSVETDLAKKLQFNGLLTNEDDLNTIRGCYFYRWASSSIPANSPTSYGGFLICNGVSAQCSQILVNYQGLVWCRAYASSSWSDWKRFVFSDALETIQNSIDSIEDDVAAISAEASGIESIAEITDTGSGVWEFVSSSNAAKKMMLTRIADNEFTVRRSGSAKVGLGIAFNVLLGSSEYTATKDYILAKNINDPGIYTVAYIFPEEDDNPGIQFYISEGSFDNKTKIDSGASFTVKDNPVCLFVYITTTFNRTTPVTVKWALYKGEEYQGFPYIENGQLIAIDPIARAAANSQKRDEPQTDADHTFLSWGYFNMMANARQILDIKWTPTAATMPKNASSYYPVGVEVTGLPYSSVRDNDKAIGTNVSIHTFMTAVHDPESVLYTRRSSTSNAHEYYGTVCSGLCNHAYGLGMNLTNTFLRESDWFTTVPLQDLQPGDMIAIPNHVAMIYDVKKDKYGRIEKIDVMEEVGDNDKKRSTYTYESFRSKYLELNFFLVRRYNRISEIEYTSTPFIACFDEDPDDFIYPDVQTDHGDRAVFGYCADPVSTDYVDYANVIGIDVNVIDAKDYASIVVTREGASSPIVIRSAVSSFKIPGNLIQPGLYTITATGPSGTSTSTFFVADVMGTWDLNTGSITFSSTNAAPILVDVYKTPAIDERDSDGKYRVSCKPYVLSDAEIHNGYADVSSLVDAENGYIHAKVTFDTPYGQAIWRSEAGHPMWDPI